MSRLDQSGDPELCELLALALEQVEAGESPDLEALCARRPELIPQISEALQSSSKLAQLSASAARVDPMIGTVVAGRYTLEARVGAGGMGVVYAAADAELHRKVAVKLLHPTLGEAPEFDARLRREAEVLAAVQHESIVTVHDGGRDESGRPFLVMPLLAGKTCDELLERVTPADARSREFADTSWIAAQLGEQPELEGSYVRQAARWIASIARGLAEVHERGVVHRDVKPSNIFVQRDGTPILLDFGLVSLSAQETLAGRDAPLGTPLYMAPEQLNAAAELDPTADVYSLSATLYHLLTFSAPYEGTPSQVFTAILRSDPVAVDRRRPGLPRDLRAIIETGMAKDRRRRYQTAALLAQDLEAWLEFRPVNARPVPSWLRLGRRLWRQPMTRAVALLTLLAGVGWGSLEYLDARARARESQRVDLLQQVPSIEFLAPAHMREVADPELDGRTGRALARLIDVDRPPWVPGLLRASFYKVRGDHGRAATELRRWNQRHESSVLRALEGAYGATVPAAEVDAEKLPPPTTEIGRFAKALHLLWVESFPRSAAARELLQAMGTRHAFVEDLLLVLDFDPTHFIQNHAERVDALNELRDRAVRLETTRGFATALSSKAQILFLIALDRHAEAVSRIGPTLEQVPGDFSIWQNLAFAHLKQGDHRSADPAVDRQLALQPISFSAHDTKLAVLLNQDKLEAAQELLQSFPFAGGERGLDQRALRQARIQLRRALSLFRSDPSLAREHAATALETLASSPGRGARAFDEQILARAVMDPDRHFEGFVRSFIAGGIDPTRLDEVALLFPDDLNASQTRALKELLFQLERVFAPGK